MNKNYLITTGGSGGHVIPAIILYEHLSRDAKVIITTDKRGLKYFNDGDYHLRIIDTPKLNNCLLYTSPSPRDMRRSRMPSSA